MSESPPRRAGRRLCPCFGAALLTLYPDPQPGRLNTVWASAVDQTSARALLAVMPSHAEEVVPVVMQLAAEHELVCFDPQRRVVVYPPSLAVLPHLRLELCDGRIVDQPSDHEIRDALASLSLDNWHANLERRDGWFVQVGVGKLANAPASRFVLEVRDGSDAKHRRCVVQTLPEVVDAFCAYARDDTSWTARFSWSRAL